jgi:hypothetical protein
MARELSTMRSTGPAHLAQRTAWCLACPRFAVPRIAPRRNGYHILWAAPSDDKKM